MSLTPEEERDVSWVESHRDVLGGATYTEERLAYIIRRLQRHASEAIDQCLTLRAENARLSARVEELERALRLVLPQAKEWAYEHPVGANPANVNRAVAALSVPTGKETPGSVGSFPSGNATGEPSGFLEIYRSLTTLLQKLGEAHYDEIADTMDLVWDRLTDDERKGLNSPSATGETGKDERMKALEEAAKAAAPTATGETAPTCQKCGRSDGHYHLSPGRCDIFYAPTPAEPKTRIVKATKGPPVVFDPDDAPPDATPRECGKTIFDGQGWEPSNWCGLTEGHAGKCATPREEHRPECTREHGGWCDCATSPKEDR